MKFIFVLITVLFFTTGISAQARALASKKLDSVSQKVIVYLQHKQPDSIYAMAGKVFRDKITAENFNAISTNQIFPINSFADVKYIGTTRQINKYKVEGMPPLQLLIGLDADDKLETLLIQPFSEN